MIVLSTAGTLGDHLPFIALGQALQRRGHRVRAVLNPAMAEHAARAGLEFVALPDIERGAEHARRNASAWDHWAQLEGRPTTIAAPDITFDDYVAQARTLAAACVGADLLISTSIRLLGYVAHHATGVPWLTASLNPSAFVAPSADPAQAALATRRAAGLGALAAQLFAALGAPAQPAVRSEGELLASRILLASSPQISRPQLGAFPAATRVVQTGFWLADDQAGTAWQPDPALRAFMARTPRPIALSFSSQPLADPAAILAPHARAAQALGYPLLVQRGWAGFGPEQLPSDVDPAGVFFADFLPHAWLFANVACAIQHGGIGSLASALRQGCPLLIEPFGNDQFFNAARVLELGVGAAMHPHKLTAEGLARVLASKVLRPEARRRAAELGALLRAEDGLAAACLEAEAVLQPAPGAAAAPGIPRIIHQTWKGAEIPAEWRPYQEAWRTHHPGWEYRLWTDEDLRAFFYAHYAWFLPIYEGYPDPIMRVDAARYFLLFHFGGLYADLDYEPLRPFDPLLAGRRLLVGLEPAAHMELPITRATGLPHMLCNALIASERGHPFWEHVFRQLVASHKAPEPLGATGPYMLTHAYNSYPRPAELYVEPAERLHPITSDQRWSAMEPAQQHAIAGHAYGLHHWHNSWCHEPIARQQRTAPVSLLERGRPVLSGQLDMNEYALAAEPPLVSCLLITRGRPALALRAIHCYRRQRYARRELLIIDDDPAETLARAVAQLGDPSIRHLRLPDAGQSLGELRNLAVAQAQGEYVAQWDDDDLSDPERLSVQMAAILSLRADACVLHRHRLWWPDARRMAYSTRRLWEGSLIALRAALPPYPALAKGEDTPVLARLVASGRVAVLDAPQLYTYICHGANTHATAHWEQHWRAATATFEHAAYLGMLAHLVRRHQLTPDGAVDETPPPVHRSPPTVQSSPSTGHRPPSSPPRPPSTVAASPSTVHPPPVLIATPVKDAARHLPRFLSNLRRLSYPHSQISLAFLESDSIDGTHGLIEQLLEELRAEFADAQLLKQDHSYHLEQPRWEPSQQLRRRSLLAKSRNQLLDQALGEQSWVLWLDVDVADWPPDVIERLLATGKEIVAPNCIVAPGGRTFDYNTFRLKPGAASLPWAPYIIDGILQPPIGHGRHYLNDLRQHSLVELDAVGGAMLLVRADLHRRGLRFPEQPYKLHIETEGLALLAKEMGYSCWGLPNLEIIHPSR